MNQSWLLISIGIVLIGLLLFFLLKGKKGKKPEKGKKQSIDYYSLFIISVIWLAAGIALDSFLFITLGLLGTLISIENKEQWHHKQKKLSRKQEKTKIIILIVLLVAFLLALMLYFMF